MINALVSSYKSGDVIGLTLKQLIDCPAISKILIADGPTKISAKTHPFCDDITVKSVVDSLPSEKVFYEHTDNLLNQPEKCNSILKHVSSDCSWILVVDSDEVYHEDGLLALDRFLKETDKDRFFIRTIDLFPDFVHRIEIGDYKPRVYRYFDDCHCCLLHDDNHQWVDSRLHKRSSAFRGCYHVPENIRFHHLNGIRAGHYELIPRKLGEVLKPPPPGWQPGRIKWIDEETVVWKGGRKKIKSKVHTYDFEKLPKSMREHGKITL
jgi:glycosyltransferase involved in cell wall biosynthesis